MNVERETENLIMGHFMNGNMVHGVNLIVWVYQSAYIGGACAPFVQRGSEQNFYHSQRCSGWRPSTSVTGRTSWCQASDNHLDARAPEEQTN